MKKLGLIALPVAMLCGSAFAADTTVYDAAQQDAVKSGTIDYFIQGKKGASEKGNKACEDGLFYSDHYLAVFDGATDKSGKKYDGRKGGRVARDIIRGVFEELEPNTKPVDVVAKINAAYQDFYAQNKDLDFEANPIFRPTSTLIWYDLDSNTLVSIGDSKARIDGEAYGEPSKMVDELNSELRSFVLKKLNLSDEEIKKDDWGRFYILPLLKRQFEFQNNIEAPEYFQFWAVDGFNIPEEKLMVWTFDEAPKQIELSSDGYLYPQDATVASYEAKLAELLKQDPLMKDVNKSTKGIKGSNVSFDDRAVLIYNRK